MHVLTTSTAALALASAVLAGPARFTHGKRQSSSATPQEVAGGVGDAIAQFKGANLIPKPLQESWVKPEAVLSVSYNGKQAPLGSSQSISDIQTEPVYAVNFTSAQSNVFNSSASYTLMYVDGSYNGDASQGNNVTRHYLQNNVKLGSDNVFKGDDQGIITKYGPPAPPAGDGPHRYMQLVWLQPADFKAPAYPGKVGTWAGQSWDLEAYIKEANMGPIVAMSYEQIANGTESKASSTSAPASSAIASASSSILAEIAPSAAAAASSGSASSAAHASSSSDSKKSPASNLKPAAGAAAVLAAVVATLI